MIFFVVYVTFIICVISVFFSSCLQYISNEIQIESNECVIGARNKVSGVS